MSCYFYYKNLEFQVLDEIYKNVRYLQAALIIERTVKSLLK